MTNFSVAVTSGYGDSKQTTWVRCALWGKDGGQHHPVSQYLKKGTKVGIQGPIRLREYTKSDGSGSGVSLECNVREITLCGSQEQQGQSNQADPGGRQYAKQQAQQQVATGGGDFNDDDIPF